MLPAMNRRFRCASIASVSAARSAGLTGTPRRCRAGEPQQRTTPLQQRRRLGTGRDRPQRADDKPIRLFDGGGLYLLVNPNGSRWWRFKYRYEGKERGISFGVYPDVSLKRARLGRDQARQLLVDGIDPSAQRQADKQSRRITFEAVASEWLELQAQNLAAITLAKAYL